MRKLWSSFRVRLLVGAFLWTLGLLYITHVTSVFIFVGPQSIFPLNRVLIMSGVAIALVIVGFVVVREAFGSFGQLRRGLADVHEGRQQVITGEYVSEVQPLVNDLNTLLEHHDRRVRDALAKAGDLAHGLKTPLAVLRQEAERARAAGQHDLAESLSLQVDRMHRHIDYHLAHARAAASGATPGTRCTVAESAAAIVRTLERLHRDRALDFDINLGQQHTVRGGREDLDEMLGNVLENACKWARTRVAVSSAVENGRVIIMVDDDGPGIPKEMREAVLQRGVRIDEAAPGTGLGLAITRDLVELYGGAILLDASPLGGLRARLELPRAQS